MGHWYSNYCAKKSNIYALGNPGSHCLSKEAFLKKFKWVCNILHSVFVVFVAKSCTECTFKSSHPVQWVAFLKEYRWKYLHKRSDFTFLFFFIHSQFKSVPFFVLV